MKLTWSQTTQIELQRPKFSILNKRGQALPDSQQESRLTKRDVAKYDRSSRGSHWDTGTGMQCQDCRMVTGHSQDSEPRQLLTHSRWEQSDACTGQGPAGRTETELAPGPEPCHSQPPIL